MIKNKLNQSRKSLHSQEPEEDLCIRITLPNSQSGVFFHYPQEDQEDKVQEREEDKESIMWKSVSDPQLLDLSPKPKVPEVKKSRFRSDKIQSETVIVDKPAPKKDKVVNPKTGLKSLIQPVEPYKLKTVTKKRQVSEYLPKKNEITHLHYQRRDFRGNEHNLERKVKLEDKMHAVFERLKQTRQIIEKRQDEKRVILATQSHANLRLVKID